MCLVFGASEPQIIVKAQIKVRSRIMYMVLFSVHAHKFTSQPKIMKSVK